MKRYGATYGGINRDLIVMEEDLFGDYVKFSDVEPLIDLLERAESAVRTHAMQSYSKVSSNLAEEISEALKKAGIPNA